MAATKNIAPWPAVAIDTSTIGRVAASPTIIRTMAPQRSVRGARLKNAHHTATPNPPRTPAITPTSAASGTTMVATNHTSNWSATMTTPGHSRSGFRRVGASDRCRPSDIVYSSDVADSVDVPVTACNLGDVRRTCDEERLATQGITEQACEGS